MTNPLSNEGGTRSFPSRKAVFPAARGSDYSAEHQRYQYFLLHRAWHFVSSFLARPVFPSQLVWRIALAWSAPLAHAPLRMLLGFDASHHSSAVDLFGCNEILRSMVGFDDNNGMDRLNYHHLYYFRTIAQEGSLSQAATRP